MMTKHNLTLIRQQEHRLPKQSNYATGFPMTNLHSASAKLPPFLTKAERIEGTRFKNLTIKRAARQAKLQRIVSRLQDWDNANAA